MGYKGDAWPYPALGGSAPNFTLTLKRMTTRAKDEYILMLCYGARRFSMSHRQDDIAEVKVQIRRRNRIINEKVLHCTQRCRAASYLVLVGVGW
jgi:hypothetical protein